MSNETDPEKTGFNSGPIAVRTEPAEIIFTAEGTFAILQTNARCPEDVLGIIETTKEAGDKNLGLPGEIGEATKKVVPYPVVIDEISRILPTTVFIARRSNTKVTSIASSN